MTAEISIMNKSAIALAADSAVTVRMQNGQKIFNTVNKLFMLSKFHPVGIMIYGNAEIMGIPWEIVIKRFRENIGNKKFSQLVDYENAFVEFLTSPDKIFSSKKQLAYFKDVITGYYIGLRKEINSLVEEYIESNKKIYLNKIKLFATKVIKSHYNTWDTVENLPFVSAEYKSKFFKKYSKTLDDIKLKIFEKMPISINSSKLLKKIALMIFTKDRFSVNNSGIVIAGFGEDELFPGLIEILTEGIVNNQLKYKKSKSMQINHKNNASITPFAQSEMVATFMEGIDPDYNIVLKGYLNQLLGEVYPNLISDAIGKTKDEKIEIDNKLKKIGKDLLGDFNKETLKYKRQKHIDPILGIVSILPKDELAGMAESFVNLTSLKRRISMDAETVGGPIDVAVISKGDGFVWIKRKHYFKAELNPSFFSNYYQNCSSKKGG